MHSGKISIVVATRNRLRALEMSLPLMIRQTLTPREIIVVDSSDEPEPVRALVEGLAKKTNIPMRYLQSAPGLTRQRNVGLAQVSGPIVAFPDDDSLLLPSYLEEVARIYAADTDEALAGVTVAAAGKNVWEQTGDTVTKTYESKSSGLIRRCLERTYMAILRRVAPFPYSCLRQEIQASRELPDAVRELGCSLVADQEGFRMSFRTRLLRERPFNECLTGYSLGEDIDVCYGLAGEGMFAQLNKPLIYHHAFPGHRADGFRLGVMEAANIAYIVTRHTQPGAAARKACWPWLRFQTVKLMLRGYNPHQRERLRGLISVRRHVGRLLAADKADADDLYRGIMERFAT